MMRRQPRSLTDMFKLFDAQADRLSALEKTVADMSESVEYVADGRWLQVGRTKPTVPPFLPILYHMGLVPPE